MSNLAVVEVMNVEGIEPSTPGLKVHRSTTELYILYYQNRKVTDEKGVPLYKII